MSLPSHLRALISSAAARIASERPRDVQTRKAPTPAPAATLPALSTPPVDPREVIAARIATEHAHLGPALIAAYDREQAAVGKRIATIERISDGPRDLGWYYKATPNTPRSLLRTGWHAVGEPCPVAVSDALQQEIYDARTAFGLVCAPIREAAIASGLSDYEGPESTRAYTIAGRVMWATVSARFAEAAQ
jgi:hypothetical protein